ncbi:MAG TPA: TonB-dependent receptor [Nitrospirales bacterium]|nr:TonB-dependent receptor [Nitrospirales bacterium]
MYLFHRLPIAVAACSVLFFIGMLGNSVAQDTSPQRLDEVVVTATRTPVPIEHSTSSVTVIDAEAIAAKQVDTVLDVLRTVRGLDVKQLGGLGGVTSVFMRGGNSNHTLVLIDGVQANSPTTGAFDFSDLTVENIERIEIIRGAQSTLYGSDAIGGVINIMTKKGAGSVSGFLSSEYGSFGTFQERAGVSGGSERVDYALTVSRLDSDGISRANEKDGNPEEDGYENTTVSGRFGVTVLGDGRLDATIRYTKSEADIDAAFPFADDLDSTSERDALVLSTTFSKSVTSWWDQRLQLSLNDDVLQGKDQDEPTDFSPTGDNGFLIDIQAKRLDWQHDFMLSEQATITAGYELEHQKARSRENFTKSLTNQAGYAQLQLNPVDNLFLVAGGRFDANTLYENEFTYKVSGSYHLAQTGTTLRSSYGTGFRGPTLNELFFPGFGNLDLEPETSKGYDVGIEQEVFTQLVVGATYFHNSFDDLIVGTFDPATNLFQTENINDARSRGIEAYVRVSPMDNLDVQATYTHTATRDRETRLRLARRPVNKGNLNIMYAPWDRLQTNLDLLLVDSSFNDTFNSQRVAGYGVINMAGSYDITKNVHAFVRIDNLLDQEYEEVFGFGTFGRAAFGGLKLTF